MQDTELGAARREILRLTALLAEANAQVAELQEVLREVREELESARDPSGYACDIRYHVP